MANVFDQAKDLWSRISSGNQPQMDPQVDQLKTNVHHAFRLAFRAITSTQDLSERFGNLPINTPDDVVALLRTWCREWQRHSQNALYGRHGLNYAIGQVKILAPRLPND